MQKVLTWEVHNYQSHLITILIKRDYQLDLKQPKNKQGQQVKEDYQLVKHLLIKRNELFLNIFYNSFAFICLYVKTIKTY